MKPAKADGGVLVTEGCINKGLRKRKTTLIHVPLRPLPPGPAEVARKNNALRKKRPGGYVNKEKRTKGTLIRKFFHFLPEGTSIRNEKH